MATFIDSVACMGMVTSSSTRELGVEARRFVADDDRRRYPQVDLLGRLPAGGDRADPAYAGVAERLHHLHRGYTLQDLDRETRSGRGSYDFGIVRVDRSRARGRLSRRRPRPRCGSAFRRCRDR